MPSFTPRKCPPVPAPFAASSRARRDILASGSVSSRGSVNITQSSLSWRYCTLTSTPSTTRSTSPSLTDYSDSPVFSAKSEINASKEFIACVLFTS